MTAISMVNNIFSDYLDKEQKMNFCYVFVRQKNTTHMEAFGKQNFDVFQTYKR